MNDLIERLRNFEGSDALGNGDFSLLHEAAAALEAVRRNAGVLVPPEGYALVSVEMLRIWGKLDEVRECCRYLKHATPQPAHVDDEALRAAAPELLAALKKVAQALEWFAHGRCRGFDDGPPLSTSEAVELAERTIANALGHDDAALEQEADRG